MRKRRKLGLTSEIEIGSLESFRTLILSSLVLIQASCQTVKTITPDMPIVVDGVFGSCSGSDGGGFMSVEKGGEFAFGSELDWLAQEEKAWTLEAYNSFGQTIGKVYANLELRSLVVKMNHAQAKSITTHEGKVFFDGHYTGVNLDEIPCLFMGKIPRSWKDKIYSFQMGAKVAALKVHDDDRDISISISELNGRKPSFCAFYSWSEYLGLLNHKFEYCFLGQSPSKSIIKLENGVSLKWVENSSV